MKKPFIILAVLVIPLIVIAQGILKFGQWVVVNGDVDVPVALTNTTFNVSSITLLGMKGFQTTNATTVRVGFTSANGAQSVHIAPGGAAVLKDASGKRLLSVSNIWLDVETADDGVVVIYD